MDVTTHDMPLTASCNSRWAGYRCHAPSRAHSTFRRSGVICPAPSLLTSNIQQRRACQHRIQYSALTTYASGPHHHHATLNKARPTAGVPAGPASPASQPGCPSITRAHFANPRPSSAQETTDTAMYNLAYIYHYSAYIFYAAVKHTKRTVLRLQIAILQWKTATESITLSNTQTVHSSLKESSYNETLTQAFIPLETVGVLYLACKCLRQGVKSLNHPTIELRHGGKSLNCPLLSYATVGGV